MQFFSECCYNYFLVHSRRIPMMNQLKFEEELQEYLQENLRNRPFNILQNMLQNYFPLVNGDQIDEDKLIFWGIGTKNQSNFGQKNLQIPLLHEEEEKNQQRKTSEKFAQQMNQEEKEKQVEKQLPPTPQTLPEKASEKMEEQIEALVLDESQEPQIKGNKCHCQKSKCLKLYCQCFRSGGYCGAECECVGCQNLPQFEKKRQEVIKEIIAKDDTAFLEKVKYNGCRCTKSHCTKNYCECYAQGVSCGKYCKCIDCQNGCTKKKNKKRTDKKRGKAKRRF